MRLHHALRLGQPLGDAMGGELLEALAKHALAAIERDHLRIGREAVERRERARRNALRGRLAPERVEEGVEVAAAWRGERGGAENEPTRAAATRRRAFLIATSVLRKRRCERSEAICRARNTGCTCAGMIACGFARNDHRYSFTAPVIAET